MPAVFRFLGYSPLTEAKTLGECLVRHRTELEMTQKEAARQLGIDPGTLARWERGEREAPGKLAEPVTHFLGAEEVSSAQRAARTA